MPVRVYDIAKKLGLENKDILIKAKELGIAAAKVGSSSLDKISAEWLEEEIIKTNPVVAARFAPKPVEEPKARVEEKIQIIHTPPTPPEATPVPASSGASAPVLSQKPEAPASHTNSAFRTIPSVAGRFKAPKTLSAIITKIASNKLHQGPIEEQPYSPKAYEEDVTRLLNELFPFSILPGIRLFSTEPRGRIDFGFEIDNLIHVRREGIDYIIEVEAKHQPVFDDNGRWMVQYEKPSNARAQVDNHIRTMWEYLKPVSRQTELKFFSVVVSSDLGTVQKKVAGYRNAELHLCSIQELPSLLAERFNFHQDTATTLPEVLRVSQSGFLDLLRLSLAVNELGHPELSSAIGYVDRCRRTLDQTLFQKFKPSRDLWAINGSAGMGKSVLLAYTAAVLSSGHELYRFDGDVGVKKAVDTFTKIGFNADPKKGSIVIMAMSAKQLENIRGWYNLFMEQFQKADYGGDVRFRPPEFMHCRPGVSFAGLAEKCSALLVDEAHDIPQFAARELVDLHQKNGIYLVVACDRHQKLRLAGSDAKIIEGLNFKDRSTRLRQIYRNPAPVYLASLAIMFRWFAETGPKVIPSIKQMDEQFGLETVSLEDGLEVTMRSDAHPANSWCHTVASFPDCASAFAALLKEKLAPKDVLWVRFSEEDPDFDYEQLFRHFTYHDCRSHDAQKISDKYIKGQDYPIVIIEGFPGFMDRYEAFGGQDAVGAENHAWAFRRELYLCASRATAFLYFICDVPETPEVVRIRAEIQRLVSAFAVPEGLNHGGTKSWKFFINQSGQLRSLDVFTDADSVTDTVTTAPTNGGTTKSTPTVNDSAREPESKMDVATPVAPPPPTRPLSAAPVSNEPVEPISLSKSEPANLNGVGVAVPPTPADQKSVRLNLPENPVGLVEIPSLLAPPPSKSGDSKIVTKTADFIPVTSTPGLPPPVATNERNPVDAVTKNRQNINSGSLGEVATLSDVANFLQKEIAQVIDKMVSRGLHKVTPSSPVNVKFVVGLFKELSSVPPKTIQVPNKSPIQQFYPKPPIAPVATVHAPSPFPSVRSESIGSAATQTKSIPTVQVVAKHSPTPKNRPTLEFPEQMTVRELANGLSQKPFAIIAELMKLNVMASINQNIDFYLISRVAARYGFDVIRKL